MTPMRCRAIFLSLLVSASVLLAARNDQSVEELAKKAEAARLEDRPSLYIQIARKRLEDADRLYKSGDNQAARAAVADVEEYADKASDAANRSRKKLKDTEISMRKMAEKLRDIKRSVSFEDQAPIQKAVDRLEKMRDELLSRMFGKKGEK
jgi:hypothetical protein